MRTAASQGLQRNPKARLNFVLSPELEGALDAYEAHTGRGQTEVVRQLVSDWIEGFTQLPTNVELKHPEGRRTNVNVPWRVRAALDARLADAGNPTVSAVIAALLGAYLTHRIPDDNDKVLLPVRMPAALLTQFAAACNLKGEDLQESVIEMIRERVRESVDALKE